MRLRAREIDSLRSEIRDGDWTLWKVGLIFPGRTLLNRKCVGRRRDFEEVSSSVPVKAREELRRSEEVLKRMTIETMEREFRYDNLRLPDPNKKLSIDEVRTAFSATYPEIATASVTGPEAVGNKLVYYFTKAIGTKG